MALRKINWLLIGVLLLAAVPTVSAQEFFLKKGDVVVVMGDSITEQRLYSNYLEIWSQTRFPSHNLVFRNVGIGGDTSGGGNGRFKRDVLPHKPTVLTVDFGMNDGGYQAFNNQRFDPYMKGLQGIADQAKAAKIRVAWVTPQPVEHNPGNAAESYNQTLEKFGDGVKEIAKKNDGLFADQFHPYWEVIKKARDAGEKGRITGNDAVHPGPPGQALMAASILKAMKFPREVCSVEINVMGKFSSKNTKKCAVTLTKIEPDQVSFSRLDECLPFFPEQAKSILKWTSLLEDMNQYGLKVGGLNAGKYDVKYDGKTIATYTDAELAKGVNLAGPVLASGPIADQVKEVVKAVNDKTNFQFDKIYAPLILRRGLGNNPDFKDVIEKRREELLTERMAKLPEFDAAIRKALEPRSHQVDIVPAK
jgi:lysophospholipase L1-like esterase